jgi:hypothetical protein
MKVRRSDTRLVRSHNAIVERFVPADGALEPLVTGSNLPVALTVMHTAICKVRRWTFWMSASGVKVDLDRPLADVSF